MPIPHSTVAFVSDPVFSGMADQPKSQDSGHNLSPIPVVFPT